MNIDRALLGIAAGALVLRGLRGSPIREELAALSRAAERAHELWDRAARNAVGCAGTAQCDCAICAEQEQ